MKNVKFRVNLGSIDAERLQLDYRECAAGMERSVEDAAAKWLEDHGIIHAVPAETVKAVPAEPEIQAVVEVPRNTTVELPKGYETKGKRKSR